MKYGGLTLLRKRIEYLKYELVQLDKTRALSELDNQMFKDKLAEVDRMEIWVLELEMERAHKKSS